MNNSVEKQVDFSLKNTNFISNPYDWYMSWREQNPFLNYYGMTIISRHADAACALTNLDLSTQSLYSKVNAICEKLNISPSKRCHAFFEFTLSMTQGSVHQRWQSAMSSAYSPQLLNLFKKWLKDDANEILYNSNNLDIINDLSLRVWLKLFSRWMGLTNDQESLINSKIDSLRLFVDPGSLNKGNIDKALKDLDMVVTVLEEAQENESNKDSITFFSALKKWNSDLNEFSKTDIAVMAATIISGGSETTQSLVGSVFYYLSKSPHLVNDLITTPKIISKVISEVARLETPIQFVQRYAHKDTEINGKRMQKGDVILICLGSANRDEHVYGDKSDEFDIQRNNAPTLTFGKGVHQCWGQFLVKVQIETLVETFLEKNHSIELIAPPIWQTKTILLRCLEKLIVKNTP